MQTSAAVQSAERNTARTLLDFKDANRVPIVSVAQRLGIHVSPNGKSARCWRPAHSHGDRHPSISLSNNRWMCKLCDQRQGSVIDLVMTYRGCSNRDAAAWLDQQFGVGCRTAGASQAISHEPFSFEHLITSGYYGSLPGAWRHMLACFYALHKKHGATPFEAPLRHLMKKAGVGRNSAVEATRFFECVGLLEVKRERRATGDNWPNVYVLRPESAVFQKHVTHTLTWGRAIQNWQQFEGSQREERW